MAVIVTLVSTAGTWVVISTCCPSTVLAGIWTLAGTEATAGWLLVSVMVGPPPEETPLTSICAPENCPPGTGFEPVI